MRVRREAWNTYHPTAIAETLRAVVGSPQVYVRLRNVDSDELEAAAFAGLFCPDPAIVHQRLQHELMVRGSTAPSVTSSSTEIWQAPKHWGATAQAACSMWPMPGSTILTARPTRQR